MRATSALEFHHGRALKHLADTYPTVHEAVLETIQNAIDACATMIWVVVATKTRTIIVRDNGNGVSRSMFEAALLSIGQTVKDTDKLGRFGLGLISPLGKCASHTFTSSPGNPKLYLSWTFVSADILSQRVLDGIPVKERRDLVFHARKAGRHGQTTYVPWRTEVKISRFSDDHTIGKLDPATLEAHILEKYGVAMRRRNVAVSLIFRDELGEETERNITASQFRGEKLPEQAISDPDCGQTTFRLFLAPKGAKGIRGVILIGEAKNDHRISMSQLYPSVYDYLDADTAQALRSGIFEGEILNEGITLTPSRKSFVKNDALIGFLATLCEWHKNVGARYVERAQDERAEERYQRLGLRCMKFVDGMIKDLKWDHFFSNFQEGVIGKGHTRRGIRQVGETEQSFQGIHGGTGQERNHEGEGRESSEQAPKERPGHRPAVVAGPAGKRRIIVKNSSMGLRFVYSEHPGSDRPYLFDEQTGELQFNIRHPYWVMCDEKSDTAIIEYQEAVATQAVVRHSQPKEYAAQQELVCDLLLKAAAYRAANTERGRPRSKASRKA